MAVTCYGTKFSDLRIKSKWNEITARKKRSSHLRLNFHRWRYSWGYVGTKVELCLEELTEFSIDRTYFQLLKRASLSPMTHINENMSQLENQDLILIM